MIRVTFVLFFGWALLLEAQTPDKTPEQSLAGMAAQLAARTSSLLPRRATVSLEWQNLSPLPPAEWSSFRGSLESELHKAGVQTAGVGTAATPPESGASATLPRLRVTASSDTRGLLFVAEVLIGDNRQVAILPWTLPSSAQAKPRVSITTKILWTQPEPILDLLLVDSGSQMLILSLNGVASYRSAGEKWTPSETASLLLPRPMPRDPRGRLASTAGGFEAFLPVATCAGVWNPELKLTCTSSVANWPGTHGTHWVADRNVLERDAPTPSFEGWGSDWASMADPCGGAGTVAIASSPNTEHDSVRAYLILDGQANPTSDPLPLSGPVTALWETESPGQATLVVHNLQTGEYEASRLALACNQ
jgi:hypothetical protein